MKPQNILYKVIESKTITWFENNNEYLVFENTTADILKRIQKGIPTKDIAAALSKKLSVPLEKSIDFILNLESQIKSLQKPKQTELIRDAIGIKKPKEFDFIKYYKINDVVLKIAYLSEIELSYIHPKFNHLTIDNQIDFNHHFEVFINNNYIFLYVNNSFIGSWSSKEIHYFQGKLSMEIIQKIHQKEEKDWLGVFHASAISNQKKSVLLLGDSGNGKSTSLALLQANGFTCLADDFVPISTKNNEVYSFPAAISIKKNSLKTLLPIYPELETSAEYHFKRLNKTVRYLKPNSKNYHLHLPCNELIFIKYEKDCELVFKEMSKLDAFQQLVPDSWLSPIKENAAAFLNWFDSATCYELKYSNNATMIATVKTLFNNEL